MVRTHHAWLGTLASSELVGAGYRGAAGGEPSTPARVLRDVFDVVATLPPPSSLETNVPSALPDGSANGAVSVRPKMLASAKNVPKIASWSCALIAIDATT